MMPIYAGAQENALVQLLAQNVLEWLGLKGRMDPLDTAIAQAERAANVTDPKERFAAMKAVRQSLEELKTVRDQTLSLRNEITAQVGALAKDRQELLDRTRKLEDEKKSLEFRERLLATGLVASLSTLMIALFAGLSKIPSIRIDLKLKEIELRERQIGLQKLSGTSTNDAA